MREALLESMLLVLQWTGEGRRQWGAGGHHGASARSVPDWAL